MFLWFASREISPQGPLRWLLVSFSHFMQYIWAEIWLCSAASILHSLAPHLQGREQSLAGWTWVVLTWESESWEPKGHFLGRSSTACCYTWHNRWHGGDEAGFGAAEINASPRPGEGFGRSLDSKRTSPRAPSRRKTALPRGGRGETNGKRNWRGQGRSVVKLLTGRAGNLCTR